MSEDLIQMFRDFTDNRDMPDSRVKDYLWRASNDLNKALDMYFDDRQKAEARANINVEQPIDVSFIKSSRNAFEVLKKGAELPIKKASFFNGMKKRFHESFGNFQKPKTAKITDLIENNSETHLDNINDKDDTISQNSTGVNEDELSQKHSDKNADNVGKFQSTPKRLGSEKVGALREKIKGPISNTKMKKRNLKELEEEFNKNQNMLSAHHLLVGSAHFDVIFNEAYERLENGVKLDYKVETINPMKGLSKKLQVKRPSQNQGYVYLTCQDTELVRLHSVERHFFNLLRDDCMCMEIIIDNDLEKEYEIRFYRLKIFFFLRMDLFRFPIKNSHNLTRVEQNLIDAFARYKPELRTLFEMASIMKTEASPLEKVTDDKVRNILINRNFYSELNNIKLDYEDYRDLSPSEAMTISLHDFQKMGLYWLALRENHKMSDFAEEKKHIHPMWTEFSLDFTLLKPPSDEELLSLINYLQNQNQKNFESFAQLFFYFNNFTGQVTFNFPYHDIDNFILGGILADEMGLGKTIMMLSLVGYSQVNPAHEETIRQVALDRKRRYYHKMKSKDSFIEEKPFAKNLIVMPTTLLHQWEEEINSIFSQGFFNVYIYKEDNKKAYIDLSRYDIVLTSYGIVRQDFFVKDYSHNLFRYKWLRIILDEANNIRNLNNQITKAILELDGCSKWCVTGTPIENSISDLYTLFLFLDYQPWSEKTLWDQFIYNPLYKEKKVKVLSLLNRVVRPLILRRTKNNNFLDLKLKKMELIDVLLPLYEEEKYQYDRLEKKTKEEFQIDKANNVVENHLHIYEVILRLRQICDHRFLLKYSESPMNTDSLIKDVWKFIELRTAQRTNEVYDLDESNDNDKPNQSKLDFQFVIDQIRNIFSQENHKENSDESSNNLICNICAEVLEDRVLTYCMHDFCKTCIYRWLQDHQTCPNCRTLLTRSDIYSLPKYDNQAKSQH